MVSSGGRRGLMIEDPGSSLHRRGQPLRGTCGLQLSDSRYLTLRGARLSYSIFFLFIKSRVLPPSPILCQTQSWRPYVHRWNTPRTSVSQASKLFSSGFNGTKPKELREFIDNVDNAYSLVTESQDK